MTEVSMGKGNRPPEAQRMTHLQSKDRTDTRTSEILDVAQVFYFRTTVREAAEKSGIGTCL